MRLQWRYLFGYFSETFFNTFLYFKVGSDSQRVLAEINTKVLYSISGGSKEHITVSYLCSASGSLVPPRVIYKGVRNIAPIKLKHLSTDGKSGIKWIIVNCHFWFILILQVHGTFLSVLRDISTKTCMLRCWKIWINISLRTTSSAQFCLSLMAPNLTFHFRQLSFAWPIRYSLFFLSPISHTCYRYK